MLYVCDCQTEMVRLYTKQNSFIFIIEYDVTEILKVKQ